MSRLSVSRQCLPVLLPALWLSPGLAANTHLEQTLVTASRTEQTVAEALAPTTVITRADIERLQPTDLKQLLERVPGASLVRNGGYGSATSLLLRGNQGDHTLFLVDGVRIGSATLGSAAIEQINPDLIQRIEVVRGPRSSLYGSDAIGGVVNIITRRARGELRPRISVGAGSNGIHQSSVFVGGGDETLSVGMTAAHFHTDGIDNTTTRTLGRDDEDAFRETSLGFTLHHRPVEWFEAQLHYQNNQGENEYDGSCTDATTFATLACALYTETHTETLHGGVRVTPVSGWDSTLRYGHSVDDSEQLADDIDIHQTFSSGEFKTRRTQYTWQNDFNFIPGQIFTVGYDFEREEVDASVNYDVDERDNDGYFAQLQSEWGLFDTNIGYRADDNEQFGTYETANAALGIPLPGQFKVVLSYSEGFKAPTFNDLYFPNFGNPDFVPETSENQEIEVRGSHFDVDWSLSVFQNDVENLIQYNPAIFAADQTARARIEGTEFSARTELGGWMIALSASVIDPKDRDSGEYLRRRARASGSLDIDRAFGRFHVGLGWRAESSRYDGSNNSVELPGYGRLDMRLGYTVSRQWQLKLKLNNLLDKEIHLAEDGSGGFYRQPGFEAIASVVYTP